MKATKAKSQLRKGDTRMMMMTSKDKVQVEVVVAVAMVRKVGAEEQKTSTHFTKKDWCFI